MDWERESREDGTRVRIGRGEGKEEDREPGLNSLRAEERVMAPKELAWGQSGAACACCSADALQGCPWTCV